MMMFQWNAEEARKVQEEERLEDIQKAETRGEARGEARGRAEEKARTTSTIIRNLLKTTTLSFEEIAGVASTTVDHVKHIAKEANLRH